MTIGVLMLISGLLGRAATGDAPVRPFKVSSQIKPPRKLKHVEPEFPQDAKRAGLAGVVILEATISPKGAVVDTKVLREIPLLSPAAVDAVRRWRYEPTLLNGVPVPVIMTVTVSFKLTQVDSHDLLASLRHSNEGVREAAAGNLGALPIPNPGGERHVKDVMKALERLAESDESEVVRAAAFHSRALLIERAAKASPRPAEPTAPRPKEAAPPAGIVHRDLEPGNAIISRPLAWGTFVDPLGRSAATAAEDRIELQLPPAEVAMSEELGHERAPRLMKAVDGDFAVEVRVGSFPELSPPQRAFQGAGLMLWQDAANFARLEAVLVSDRAVDPLRSARYVAFQARLGGRRVDIPGAPVALDPEPTDLRLERRGDQLIALASQGGAPWRQVARASLALSRSLQVGVTASNTALSSLGATLVGFTSGPAGDLPAVKPLLPPAPVPAASLGQAAANAPVSEAPADVDPAFLEGEPAPGPDAPPKVLHTVKPAYPQDAYMRRIEGTVLVEVLIDARGNVARARVIQSVPGLDDAALAATRQWRFEPAVKNGRRVATLAHMPVRFWIDASPPTPEERN